MKDLVEYVVKSIAMNPDDVKITEIDQDDGTLLLQLEVAEDDKGRVIGRQGRVAQSIRLLLRVMAVKQGKRATLEII
jgi:hypothetical protein